MAAQVRVRLGCGGAACGVAARRVREVSGLGSPSSAGVGSVSFATGTSTVGAEAVWLSVEVMAMASLVMLQPFG